MSSPSFTAHSTDDASMMRTKLRHYLLLEWNTANSELSNTGKSAGPSCYLTAQFPDASAKTDFKPKASEEPTSAEREPKPSPTLSHDDNEHPTIQQRNAPGTPAKEDSKPKTSPHVDAGSPAVHQRNAPGTPAKSDSKPKTSPTALSHANNGHPAIQQRNAPGTPAKADSKPKTSPHVDAGSPAVHQRNAPVAPVKTGSKPKASPHLDASLPATEPLGQPGKKFPLLKNHIQFRHFASSSWPQDSGASTRTCWKILALTVIVMPGCRGRNLVTAVRIAII
ncbi:hypothetical protein RUND412_000610 [Rhizina undulata]